MKWFTSLNFQLVSILLNGGSPLGADAFAAPSLLVESRIRSRNGGRSRRSKVIIVPKATNESSDDSFEVPLPRWNCPTHEDVCAETGVTLSRYMKEMVRANPDLEEIESSRLHLLQSNRPTDHSVVPLFCFSYVRTLRPSGMQSITHDVSIAFFYSYFR